MKVDERLLDKYPANKTYMTSQKRRCIFLLEHYGFSNELAKDVIERVYGAACQGQDPLDGLEFSKKVVEDE